MQVLFVYKFLNIMPREKIKYKYRCSEPAWGNIVRADKWASNGFIKPLRAVTELSGFPVLTWLYKLLVTLAVTSSSAERAMSRVRIMKNRLCSTMLDDWFSSLMILACEKDVVDRIPVDDIIDSFAARSAPLQKLLLRN